jgi:bifunctional UDP-N-acetylglucosamine pyrophosphorylase/glucosamine-1-phosphate N-acetyltransferase
VVILAAGEGTRMRSATPKVLHSLCGRSLLGHVVGVARSLDPEHLVVVVGHGRAPVTEHLAAIDRDAVAVVQREQRGTGHATRVALDALGDVGGTVVVLYSDAPLLTGATLARLVDERAQTGDAVTVLSARVPDPTGYGRIIRDDRDGNRDGIGALTAIVEQKDATDAQRAVNEINSGTYAFDGKLLRAALARLTTANVAGEEYLTEVIGIFSREGRTMGALVAPDYRETLACNDRAQLAELSRYLRDRILDHWMRAGVTVIDPQTTWVDVDVRLEPDAVIHPNTQLLGRTEVARGAEVGPGCTLRDTTVRAGARVRNAVCEAADIGPEADVGPFTYLRPGTRLARRSKAGAYVEIKAATVGEGSKVPHLSYVGDATIGAGANIGAATVFVNYDGVEKHHTQVGDHARVGSDTMLVAPVTVGDGAYTAAGSVITEDVPPGAMGVGRAKQRNVEGWVARRRAGTPAATAAAAASSSRPASNDAPATSCGDTESDMTAPSATTNATINTDDDQGAGQ